MRNRPLITLPRLGACLALGAALLLGLLREDRAAPGSTTPPQAAASTPERRLRSYQQSAFPKSLRFVLDYQAKITVGQAKLAPTRVRGEWTMEQRGALVRLSLEKAEVSGEGAVPSAQAAMRPFVAQLEEGAIESIGFEAETPIEAKHLLSTLLSAVWLSARDAKSWEVKEQDPSGLLLSSYIDEGEGRIVRHRRYLALRKGRQLDHQAGGSLHTAGQTRYRVDAEGLAEVKVQETHRLGSKGAPSVLVELQVTLQRIAAGPSSAAWPKVQLEAIQGFVATPRTTLGADRALLDEAGPAQVLTELEALKNLPPRSDNARKFRGRMMRKVRALARLEPAHTGPLKEALIEGAQDPVKASVIAGGLAEAGTLEANAALVEAMQRLPQSVARDNVIMALGASKAPDAASAEALGAQLSDPAIGDVSALALGNQARTLEDQDPEAASAAVDTLMERYESSRQAQEQRNLLAALGNAGDPRALPLIQTALEGGDPDLGEIAAWSLRFIKDPLADQLLLSLLEGVRYSPALALPAVRAIDFRSPELWRPQLEGALSRHPEGDVREEIVRVLARWASELPPERAG